ncbi:hypothetical protein SAMN03080598_01810, partial [Algoriphagus boritolerans DSM 17298 = JCM 18970]
YQLSYGIWYFIFLENFVKLSLILPNWWIRLAFCPINAVIGLQIYDSEF